ncbi:LamG domain-containing protein [Sedimentisphaera salicampi]|uniref:LamG domain-containing protein n=1 Tax=Sedimentisphaera salicampi TaxID=1941349 RepID=UPI000B9A1ECB|nr:LamG domain-containing protein [Sedimentisphaera salicampi]OXU15161.1 hypothetical protein SMSP1_01092 [Sedimentisphaera salicampi]
MYRFLILILFQILPLTLPCEGGAAPRLWYKFESSSGYVKDACTGRQEPIEGYYRYEEGVYGKAIVFDGQTTKILCEAKYAPKLADAFTIDAWIAPQTYSWNWAGIVSQKPAPASDSNDEGCQSRLFLGINHEGRIGFRLNLGGEEQSCATKQPVDLLKWVHIAAVYSPQSGMELYIDGKLAAENAADGRLSAGGGDLLVGQNHCRMSPVQSEREASDRLKSRMVFDGLLDEVRIFDYDLTEAQIKAYYSRSKPDVKQPLQYRQMPSGANSGNNKFGAFYTTLSYSPEWDAHWPIGPDADIVVAFDKHPVSMLFWHGTGYGAVWSSENGKLMADQSLERVGGDKSPWGCSEHMSDKQCRYSHVRLIANSDARAVVHWRYAISDIKYNIFGMEDNDQSFGEWADEYYYIYPDAAATRHQKLWTDHLRHEWQETIALNQPGTAPEDNIELDAMVFANLKGESCVYSWRKRPDRKVSKPEDSVIQLVNLKSCYKPFIIFPPENNLKLFSPDAIVEGQHFPWWNHWPAAQIPNDGRRTQIPDRPSHSSLSQSLEDSDAIKQTSENTFEAVTLTGMTNQGVEGLVPLAKSWNNPPVIGQLSDGFKNEGYSRKQRAYIIQSLKESQTSTLEFTLAANKDRPVFNPAFLIRGWGAEEAVVHCNGKKLGSSVLRTGFEPHPGRTDLVVWVEKEFRSSVQFEIEPAKNEAPGSCPKRKNFGAFYTKIDSGQNEMSWPVSGEPDVEILFDNSASRFIFCRENSFVPAFSVKEGLWYINAFMQEGLNQKPAESFYSPLLDNRCLYSRARVIEDSDARVAVHVRHAPVDEDSLLTEANPLTGWSDWVDEYYTFYPDSIGARKVVFHCRSSLSGRRVYQAGILQNLPQKDESDFQDGSFMLANLKGQSAQFKWAAGQKDFESIPERAFLQAFNVNNEASPFIIADPEKGEFAFHHPPEQPGFEDGAFSSLIWQPHEIREGSNTWSMLFGAANCSSDELARLGRSWLNAPKLEIVSTGRAHQNEGYDPSQRAYIIDCRSDKPESDFCCKLLGSKESPIFNPALVLKNWGTDNAQLWLDNQKMEEGKDYRLGHQRNKEGNNLTVWLDIASFKEIEIKLKRL